MPDQITDHHWAQGDDGCAERGEPRSRHWFDGNSPEEAEMREAMFGDWE
jgi:hypothetical protein